MLASCGCNAVRVFVAGRTRGNPGVAGNPETTVGVYGPYMDNVADFLRALKERDPRLLSVLLGVEFQNELYVTCDRWPFTVREGRLAMPNGGVYDMSDPRQRRKLMDE